MSAQKIPIYKQININLLPGATDFEKTSTGKVLKWALGVGRYIVVFTELIVILAFLARFKLDRDITDLHESIEQKKAIVLSASSLETNFKDIQARLNGISEITKKQTYFDKLVDDFSLITPVDVYISDLNFSQNQFNISGVALSEAGLATLIYQLRHSPKFSEINLSNVSRSSSLAEIRFSLSAILSPQVNK